MADAFGDYGYAATDIETMIDEKWRLRPAKAQFTRHAQTLRWFNPRGQVMRGNVFHYKVYLSPPSGSRAEDITTAVGTTGEFPKAREAAFLEMTIPWTDLRVFWGSVKYSEYADRRTRNSEDAIESIAEKVITDAELDQAFRVNQSLHQDSTLTLALVAAVYDTDGTAYTTSSSTTNAFLQIDNGSISNFTKGQILDIRTAATATVRATVVVNDVIVGNDGPPYGSSTVASIGPGIVVTIATENADDADLDAVADNDEICYSGETDDNYHGLPDWLSETQNVYRDADGTEIDRDTTGYHWMAPTIIRANDGGAAVTFDMDTHLRELADILPYKDQTGRQMRNADMNEPGIEWKEALLGITTVRICNDVVDAARDSQRFTFAGAMTDKKARRKMFGAIGFDGVIYHSPLLGSVAFQADTHARPEKLSIVDPNAFFWIKQGGGPHAIEWLMQGGSRFQPLRGSNARRTFYQDAAYWSTMALGCDQIGTCAEIQDIKSSLY